MITIVAVVVLLMTFELWIPLALLFGAIRLLATFSLSAAWEAMKAVPLWVWDFTHSVLS